MDQVQFSEQYWKIVEAYKELGSIAAVTKALHVSEVKVRRVLITEGLWSSRSSRQISDLVEMGFSPAEIAEQLSITVKAVEAYMPYRRGVYDADNQSSAAIRSEEYRKRNAAVAQKQIPSENSTLQSISHQVREENTMTTAEDLYETIMEKPPRIMKLRLTLSEEGLSDRSILEKYGKSREGITREILVPADMTLHALHYVIQRAFGWQNSHLHHFELPENVFDMLLRAFGCEDKPFYADWEKLCGIYFRFPTEDLDDIYWDDDYDGDISVKSWFRRKYKAPYRYDGFLEHYLECREAALRERLESPTIRVSPSFAEFSAAKEDGRSADLRFESIDSITFDDMNRMWEYGMEELLERIALIDLIFPRQVSLSDDWRDKIAQIVESAKTTPFVHNRLREMRLAIINASDLFDEDEDEGFIAFTKAYREYKEYVPKFDPKPIPLSDSLVYKYDYGDGWEVIISCEDVFYTKDGWDYPDENGFVIPPITKEHVLLTTEAYDSENSAVDDSTRKAIAQIAATQRPVCIKADGLAVLDDVGGVHGYCDFLAELHEGTEAERWESRVWAKGQGWTGRIQKPENIL